MGTLNDCSIPASVRLDMQRFSEEAVDRWLLRNGGIPIPPEPDENGYQPTHCGPGTSYVRHSGSADGWACDIDQNNAQRTDVALQHMADELNLRGYHGDGYGCERWGWYRYTPDFATLVCL